MTATGYIKLWRKLLEDPTWTQLAPAVGKVLVTFLLKANFRASTWYDGSQVIHVPAGCFIASYAKIAEACNISMQQTRDAFSHLERTGFATYRRTGRWTLITVCTYRQYQGKYPEAEHAGEHTVDQLRNTPENTYGTPVVEVKKRRRETPQQRAEMQHVFEFEFWPQYPRKVGKPAALRAFVAKVAAGSKPATIVAGLRAQLPELTARELRFIPHPATWLNQERWNDPVETQAQGEPLPEYREHWHGGEGEG